MPTNRRQNIPGKTPRPSRNSHRTRSSQHMSSKGSVFKQNAKTPGSTRIGASLGGRTVMSSGKRAGKHSVKAGSKPSVVKPSFSTSGPTFGPKPSFGSDPKARKGSASSSGYQPNPLKVGGPAPSKLTPEVLLTRRNLLIGAAAVGGIAGVVVEGHIQNCTANLTMESNGKNMGLYWMAQMKNSVLAAS